MSTPTQNEIDDVIDWCMEAEEVGSHFSGMTYEQGVRAAIEWMQGNGDIPSE